MIRPFIRGPITPFRGRKGSPWLLTTYKSWDDPPSAPIMTFFFFFESSESCSFFWNRADDASGVERWDRKDLDPTMAGERQAGFGYGCWTKNRGFLAPQIINFNRVFHYFHHPFWGPTPIFGNIHMKQDGLFSRSWSGHKLEWHGGGPFFNDWKIINGQLGL